MLEHIEMCHLFDSNNIYFVMILLNVSKHLEGEDTHFGSRPIFIPANLLIKLKLTASKSSSLSRLRHHHISNMPIVF